MQANLKLLLPLVGTSEHASDTTTIADLSYQALLQLQLLTISPVAPSMRHRTVQHTRVRLLLINASRFPLYAP